MDKIDLVDFIMKKLQAYKEEGFILSCYNVQIGYFIVKTNYNRVNKVVDNFNMI